MKRSALLATMIVMGACLQTVDVGSNLQPIGEGGTDAGPGSDAGPGIDAGPGSDAGLGSDAGYVMPSRADFWATDGSVPCGAECAAQVGGDPNCAGDLTISSAQEWQAFQLRGCTYFSGNLVLTPPDMTTLTATGLQRISGSLTIRAPLEEVSFPDLAVLGFNLNLLTFRPTAARFPSLTTSGSLNLDPSLGLTALELPVLQEVRGHVSINVGSMTTLNLPALTRVRGAYMGLGGVQSVSAPLLHTVVGNLGVGGAALTDLNLSALERVGNLYIRQTGLSTLRFDSLTTVMDGQLSVESNPQLRACLVDALRDQLTPAPTMYSSSDNGGMPNTCP